MTNSGVLAAARRLIVSYDADQSTDEVSFSASVEGEGLQVEILIDGNVDGLLAAAITMLRLAVSEPHTPGHHFHIDSATFANEGSIPVVVSRP